MAREQHDFKLGPAILQASGADPVPDTFRAALLRALDSKSAASFAQTSKGSLNMLLTEWPGNARLTIRVRPASAEWPEQLLKRLHTARQQLIRRGSKATTLHLVQRCVLGLEGSALQAIISALGAGHTWPNLHLSLQFQHLTPQRLAAVGAAFPGLRSLSIGLLFAGAGEVALPLPAAFPDLQHLTIRRVPPASQAAFFLRVAQYLPQLVSLTVDAQPESDGVSFTDRLFTGTAVSHTLEHITLPCILRPRLAAQLTQRAPAVETVTVQGVTRLVHDATDGLAEVCSWRTLRVKPGPEPVIVQANEIDWLPVPAAGKLVLDLSACRWIKFRLPLLVEVVAKLRSLDIQGCKTVMVGAYAEDGTCVPPADQPQAVRDGLAQLVQHVQTRGTQLVLEGFSMSPAFAAELTAVAASAQWGSVSLHGLQWASGVPLAAPLPPLRSVGLRQPLTDTLLAELQQCLPAVEALYVRGVALQSMPRAGTCLPWRVSRRLGEENLTDWLPTVTHLVDLVTWDIDVLKIELTKQQTCAVADWAAQLRRMRFAHVGAVHLIAFSDMDPITWPDPAKLPGIFRACLTLANALPCKADSLTLYGWAATTSFVELLARLPKWTGELKLVLQGGVSHGYYPLASASIPTTYTKWVIRDEEDFALTPAEREAFLMHAPSSRTAETPLHIRVISASSYGFGQADAQWRALGVCEHVTIEYGTW